MGDERDVARQEPAPNGVLERAADDEVDLVHGLRRERDSAVARVKEPLVERLEMMRAQPSQADPTERRDDVVLNVAAVPAVGGCGEHDPLARQPASREVGAEGERPDLVVASVAVAGESGGKPFGVSPLGAGGMPAAPFLAGHRVDAFVDHCVPAAALLGDISLHDDAPSGARRSRSR